MAMSPGPSQDEKQDNAPITLPGTSWLVEDIDGRGVIDMAQTTIQFGEEGDVRGSTACNRYSGQVGIDGAELIFKPMAVTRRACPQAIMDQEQRFLAAIHNARSYKIDDEKRLMFIYGEETDRLMRLSLMTEAEAD